MPAGSPTGQRRGRAPGPHRSPGPSLAPGRHYDRRRPEDLAVGPVAGPDDVGDRAGNEVLTGDGADRFVASGVEGLAGLVVPPGIAEVCEDRECLLVHGTHALEDLVRVGGGVLEGTLEVVEDRQPAGRHRGALLLAGADHVPGAPLAEVVQLRGGTAPGVLEVGDLLPCRGGVVDGGVVDGALVDALRFGGLWFGHDHDAQCVVNSASITSSESSPGPAWPGPADSPAEPAPPWLWADMCRAWAIWCSSPVRDRRRSVGACSSSALRASLISISARARSCCGTASPACSSWRCTW